MHTRRLDMQDAIPLASELGLDEDNCLAETAQSRWIPADEAWETGGGHLGKSNAPMRGSDSQVRQHDRCTYQYHSCSPSACRLSHTLYTHEAFTTFSIEIPC
jgi:hypothetical protein